MWGGWVHGELTIPTHRPAPSVHTVGQAHRGHSPRVLSELLVLEARVQQQGTAHHGQNSGGDVDVYHLLVRRDVVRLPAIGVAVPLQQSPNKEEHSTWERALARPPCHTGGGPAGRACAGPAWADGTRGPRQATFPATTTARKGHTHPQHNTDLCKRTRGSTETAQAATHTMSSRPDAVYVGETYPPKSLSPCPRCRCSWPTARPAPWPLC